MLILTCIYFSVFRLRSCPEMFVLRIQFRWHLVFIGCLLAQNEKLHKEEEDHLELLHVEQKEALTSIMHDQSIHPY